MLGGAAAAALMDRLLRFRLLVLLLYAHFVLRGGGGCELQLGVWVKLFCHGA
jgi:hypothetical protein